VLANLLLKFWDWACASGVDSSLL